MAVNLSDNARKQFETLYSLQGEKIEDTFSRVSSEFATDERERKIAYDLLIDNVWRPNTPVFLNAGSDHKIFSACYVVGLEDSMNSIYDVANAARRIFQYGAGIGIPVGNLREQDAYIYEGNREKAPEGKSSGPITFMKLYDAVGETTKSGGRVRRAAILCSMPVWHPDIMQFISCKEEDGRLANMNISVNITDAFMTALKDNISYHLISPSDGKKVGELNAQDVWNRIADMAWKSADPGVIFIDTMNRFNPLIKTHMIEATNPCGEQPLIPWSCCNLSAINIAKFVMDGVFDWNKLYDITFEVMGLMDNNIDVMDYPDPRFKDSAYKFRQVGIGPMGLADAMCLLDIKYDSLEGKRFAGRVMRTMTTACVHKSAMLAKEHGTFHDYEIYKNDMERIIAEHIGLSDTDHTHDVKEVYELVCKYGVRNCQYTTAQPTGTTALSCDASYGMEPLFGVVFYKNYISGESVPISHPVFHERFKDEPWYGPDLLDKIANNYGSLKGIRGIPDEVRKVFAVAHDIKYKDRIDLQAEIQKYCSTAISSTVNLPKETTKEEIADLYKYAYEKGLKGVTIYRDGSKKFQPVTFEKEAPVDSEFKRPTRLHSETFIMETGNGKMYVTISDYKHKPLEVFIYVGKSGQILNTFSEALGRLISIAFQNGVPVETITKTLVGINSDKPTWYRFEETDKRPTQILSIPDGIAQLLNRYYAGQKYEGELSGEICPKCGKEMRAIEGCFTCLCGHSKCS